MTVAVTRKRLTRYAVGETSISGRKITIKAEKSPFFRGKYEVLEDGNVHAEGDFFLCLGRMIENPEKTDLLLKVAMALRDSALKQRSMINHFSKVELFCLVMLADGPKSIKEIVDKTGISENIVYKAMMEFKAMQLVPLAPDDRSVDESGHQRHGLTETGRSFIKRIRRNFLFKEIKKDIESVDISKLPYGY